MAREMEHHVGKHRFDNAVARGPISQMFILSAVLEI